MTTSTTISNNHGQRRGGASSSSLFYAPFLTALLLVLTTASVIAFSEREAAELASSIDETLDYGNHNMAWEDGHSSLDEFGHENDPEICGVRRVTVQEWEDESLWDTSDQPVIVVNVTDGWAANTKWKLDEILKRYPDAEATMGDGRRVGEIGPDDGGNLLTHTTVKEFITKYMYHPFKYFFDRKIAIPKGMLDDCHPFPMPTRRYLEDQQFAADDPPREDQQHALSSWRDHLAIAIGADLQGLSFHHHGAAWNVVIFGKKRWIMYDPKRWQGDDSDSSESYYRRRRVALASPGEWETILPTPEWIRQLYPDPFRQHEIRNYGHDCIQHAGEMIFVPRRWMHMVVNIGDTVSVVSEEGLDRGEGKVPEDFLYDPFEDDGSDGDEENDEEEYEAALEPPPLYGSDEYDYEYDGFLQDDPEFKEILDGMEDRDAATQLYKRVRDEAYYKYTQLNPDNWKQYDYWDIHAYFRCSRIFAGARDIYSLDKWDDLRQLWRDFAKLDKKHWRRAADYGKGIVPEPTYRLQNDTFESPVEPFQTEDKGCGVRAKRDISQGELILKATNNTVVFTHGHTFRKFLFATYERYDKEEENTDADTACDLLTWSWVQPLGEGGDMVIIVNLDNGSLLNQARLNVGRDGDEDGEGWESPNIRCGKEGDRISSLMECYATKDIKKAGEILRNHRAFNNPEYWSRMGL